MVDTNILASYYVDFYKPFQLVNQWSKDWEIQGSACFDSTSCKPLHERYGSLLSYFLMNIIIINACHIEALDNLQIDFSVSSNESEGLSIAQVNPHLHFISEIIPCILI